MFKKGLLNSLYIISLGAISSYSLPPYNYFIINFITFSLFFIFLFNKKKKLSNNKSFFKYGWYFGFGYFLFSLYWIAISLTFDQSFQFLIPLAIVLLPAFLATFYGLMTYLFSIFYSENITISFLIFSAPSAHNPRLVRELAGIMRAWCAPGGASSRTHSHNPRLVRELAAQGDNFEGFGGHWWKSENNGFVCTEPLF